MIKLYDKQNNFIKMLTSFVELMIGEDLEKGIKVCTFSVPIKEGILVEEQRVEIDGYRYVIKGVEIKDNQLQFINCEPDLRGLNGKILTKFIGSNIDLNTALTQLTENTGWSFDIKDDIQQVISLNLKYKTVFECLDLIKELFHIEFYFNTASKVIEVYKERGDYNTYFVINEKNLSDCQISSNTTSLVTRLYPYGKNGLSIAVINDGIPYIENFSYTDEVVIGYMIDTDITTPQDLFEKAQSELYKLSVPQTTYKIKIINFKDNLKIGDTIKVIDTFKNIETYVRIVKMVVYPFNPDKSYIEVGNPSQSFFNIYKNFQASTNKFNLNMFAELSAIANEGE